MTNSFVLRLVCASAMLLTCAAAATLPDEVRVLLQKHKIPAANAAVYISRIGATSPLAVHQPQKLFNPASVVKLPLAVAAFDILGARHQWTTAFARDGEIVDGVLRGNLIIIGGGAPQLTADKFLFYINDLRRRGIHKISGKVIIDDTLFAPAAHNPAAFDGASSKPYNVGGSALAVNYKAHKISFVPQGKKIRVYSEPPNAHFTIDNQIRVGRTRCRNWRGRISERYRGDENRITLILRGRYSPRCGEQSFYTAALSHAANAAGVFGAYWRQLGGEWNGEWEVGATPTRAVTIAAFNSSSLAESVMAMNKNSNNVMARNIFLSLAQSAGTPPYTLGAAREVFADWMRTQGVVGDFFVDNGSGLSRHSRLSAIQLARLMHNLWAHPLRAEIIASLPVLGIDGTLAKRLQKTAAAQGHLKTGSLSGIKNIVGFVRDKQGRDLIFICLLQSSNGRGKRFQDSLIRWARALP